jgi:Transcription factor zinc-finger
MIFSRASMSVFVTDRPGHCQCHSPCHAGALTLVGTDAYNRGSSFRQGGAMEDSKDRLGKRLKEKEKGEEDRYFAEKDREALDRLKKRDNLDVVTLALGHCPRCGAALTPVKVHGVEVQQCPVECGLWLDKGELELIARRERDSWLGRLFYRPRLEE